MNQKRCFVIMPFSQTSDEHAEEYWNKHFESFLKPLIRECGDLEIVRSEALRGDILKQIIQNLYDSDIVVADLTDKNPNVFWELGVRQSFRYGTITIAEERTDIPFDVSTKGMLFYYPKDHMRNQEFRKQFKKAIMDCLTNPNSPDSRVLEIVPVLGSRHLAPPVHHTVLPVYYTEENKPRAGFIITNLGPLPAEAIVTVTAFLGNECQGLIESAIPYYSGKIPWNLDAGFQFRGNFPLKQEWLDSEKTLRLEVKVIVIDADKRSHEKPPICYTHVKDKNYWYVEPTSFNRLKGFVS